MRNILIISLVLLISCLSLAQERTGSIYGKVVDPEGNGLPGVAVTLTGSVTAPISTLTSTAGNFKFLSLSPSDDYNLKAELQGFKTRIEQGIIVTVGRSVNKTLMMEMTTIKEEVIVVAKVPVVDSTTVSFTQSFSADLIQSLPNARDPWEIAKLSPGIMVDRENVGGSELGMQALYVARGESFQQNVFAIDGVVVTDATSTGMPNTYDIDAFQEMSISFGGSDVTMQTGGVALNIVTKRGGNMLKLGGRFFLTDHTLQAQNLTAKLMSEGVVATNKIEDIRDYGFNLGGHFIKDKLWYWFSYGVQTYKTFGIDNIKQDGNMTVLNGKINLQLIPANKIEIFGALSRKELFGKDPTASNPAGRHRFDWFENGNPTFKIQDEHMFGDKLFVSARYASNQSGYREFAMGNEGVKKPSFYNVTTGMYDVYVLATQEGRPTKNFYLQTNYFNEQLLGLNHSMKAGFEYADRRTHIQSRGYTGYYYKFNTPTMDITGDGKADIVPDIYQVRTSRFGLNERVTDAVAGYFSDSIKKGRFNIILGVRYDKQYPYSPPFTVATGVDKTSPAWYNYFTERTADALNYILPPFTVPEIRPDYNWGVFSPRLGITWNVEGNGRTIAKLSYANYGNFMTTGSASYFAPVGLTGNSYFYWLDANKDGFTDYTELWWRRTKTYTPYRVFDDNGNFIGDWVDAKGIGYSGFDPANPTLATESQTKVDKNVNSPRTQEVILTLEREIIENFGVTLNLIYRNFYNGTWSLDYYPDTGHRRSKADYVQVGIVPDQIGPYSTEKAAGRPYYMLAAGQATTDFDILTNNRDKKNRYYGLDLIFNKRLSKRWMVNCSFTLQKQKSSFGENGYLDPTNIWATDNTMYASSMGGGAGKLAQYVFSNWIVKFSGIYQLGQGFNIALTLFGREGNIILESFTITDYRAPNSVDISADIYLDEFGHLQLPNMWKADFRIEKELKMGNFGKIYLMLDVFNLFNSATVNRRYQKHLGTYFVYADPSLNIFTPDLTSYKFNEILNPRVARLGLRFQF